MNRYLDPTNDVAFKKVFSNKERLKDFLNSVLRLEEGSKIIELTFIPQEELPSFQVGRRSLFDIKCLDQSGKSYIVEIQNRSEKSYLNRVQCYASHAYVSQAVKGKKHIGLMPVVLISITKYKIFDDSIECLSYHSTLESQTKKQCLLAISYLFIELPKFTKTAEELENEVDYWLYFLSQWQKDKEPPSTIKDPLVLEAYEAIEQFNWSFEEYDAYFRSRLIAESEDLEIEHKLEQREKRDFKRGEQIGLEKGLEKGREEAYQAKLHMARMLKTNGISVSVIAQSTNLSLEEIEKL